MGGRLEPIVEDVDVQIRQRLNRSASSTAAVERLVDDGLGDVI